MISKIFYGTDNTTNQSESTPKKNAHGTTNTPQQQQQPQQPQQQQTFLGRFGDVRSALTNLVWKKNNNPQNTPQQQHTNQITPQKQQILSAPQPFRQTIFNSVFDPETIKFPNLTPGNVSIFNTKNSFIASQSQTTIEAFNESFMGENRKLKKKEEIELFLNVIKNQFDTIKQYFELNKIGIISIKDIFPKAFDYINENIFYENKITDKCNFFIIVFKTNDNQNEVIEISIYKTNHLQNKPQDSQALIDIIRQNDSSIVSFAYFQPSFNKTNSKSILFQTKHGFTSCGDNTQGNEENYIIKTVIHTTNTNKKSISYSITEKQRNNFSVMSNKSNMIESGKVEDDFKNIKNIQYIEELEKQHKTNISADGTIFISEKYKFFAKEEVNINNQPTMIKEFHEVFSERSSLKKLTLYLFANYYIENALYNNNKNTIFLCPVVLQRAKALEIACYSIEKPSQKNSSPTYITYKKLETKKNLNELNEYVLNNKKSDIYMVNFEDLNFIKIDTDTSMPGSYIKNYNPLLASLTQYKKNEQDKQALNAISLKGSTLEEKCITIPILYFENNNNEEYREQIKDILTLIDLVKKLDPPEGYCQYLKDLFKKNDKKNSNSKDNERNEEIVVLYFQELLASLEKTKKKQSMISMTTKKPDPNIVKQKMSTIRPFLNNFINKYSKDSKENIMSIDIGRLNVDIFSQKNPEAYVLQAIKANNAKLEFKNCIQKKLDQNNSQSTEELEQGSKTNPLLSLEFLSIGKFNNMSPNKSIVPISHGKNSLTDSIKIHDDLTKITNKDAKRDNFVFNFIEFNQPHVSQLYFDLELLKLFCALTEEQQNQDKSLELQRDNALNFKQFQNQMNTLSIGEDIPNSTQKVENQDTSVLVNKERNEGLVSEFGEKLKQNIENARKDTKKVIFTRKENLKLIKSLKTQDLKYIINKINQGQNLLVQYYNNHLKSRTWYLLFENMLSLKDIEDIQIGDVRFGTGINLNIPHFRIHSKIKNSKIMNEGINILKLNPKDTYNQITTILTKVSKISNDKKANICSASLFFNNYDEEKTIIHEITKEKKNIAFLILDDNIAAQSLKNQWREYLQKCQEETQAYITEESYKKREGGTQKNDQELQDDYLTIGRKIDNINSIIEGIRTEDTIVENKDLRSNMIDTKIPCISLYVDSLKRLQEAISKVIIENFNTITENYKLQEIETLNINEYLRHIEGSTQLEIQDTLVFISKNQSENQEIIQKNSETLDNLEKEIRKNTIAEFHHLQKIQDQFIQGKRNIIEQQSEQNQKQDDEFIATIPAFIRKIYKKQPLDIGFYNSYLKKLQTINNQDTFINQDTLDVLASEDTKYSPQYLNDRIEETKTRENNTKIVEFFNSDQLSKEHSNKIKSILDIYTKEEEAINSEFARINGQIRKEKTTLEEKAEKELVLIEKEIEKLSNNTNQFQYKIGSLQDTLDKALKEREDKIREISYLNGLLTKLQSIAFFSPIKQIQSLQGRLAELDLKQQKEDQYSDFLSIDVPENDTTQQNQQDSNLEQLFSQMIKSIKDDCEVLLPIYQESKNHQEIEAKLQENIIKIVFKICEEWIQMIKNLKALELNEKKYLNSEKEIEKIYEYIIVLRFGEKYFQGENYSEIHQIMTLVPDTHDKTKEMSNKMSKYIQHKVRNEKVDLRYNQRTKDWIEALQSQLINRFTEHTQRLITLKTEVADWNNYILDLPWEATSSETITNYSIKLKDMETEYTKFNQEYETFVNFKANYLPDLNDSILLSVSSINESELSEYSIETLISNKINKFTKEIEDALENTQQKFNLLNPEQILNDHEVIEIQNLKVILKETKQKLESFLQKISGFDDSQILLYKQQKANFDQNIINQELAIEVFAKKQIAKLQHAIETTLNHSSNRKNTIDEETDRHIENLINQMNTWANNILTNEHIKQETHNMIITVRERVEAIKNQKPIINKQGENKNEEIEQIQNLKEETHKKTEELRNLPEQTEDLGNFQEQTADLGNLPEQTAELGNLPEKTADLGNLQEQTEELGNSEKINQKNDVQTIESIKDRVDKSEDQIRELDESVQQQMLQLKKDKSKLEEELKTVKEEQQQELKAKEELIEFLQKQITLLEQQQKQQLQEKDKQTAALQQQKQQIANLKLEQQQYTKQLQLEVQKKEEQLKQLEQVLIQQQQLQQQEQQIASKQQIEALQQKEEQITKLKQQITELQEQQKKQLQEKEELIAALQALQQQKLKEQQQELLTASQKQTYEQQQIADLKQQELKAKEELQEKDKKIAALQLQTYEQQQQIERELQLQLQLQTYEELQEKEEEITRLKQQIQLLQDKNTQIEFLLQQKQQELLTESQQQIAALQQIEDLKLQLLQDKNTQITLLEQQQKQQQQTYEQLLLQLQQLQEKLQQKEQQIEELIKSLQQKQKEKEELRESQKQTYKQLQLKEEQLKQLEKLLQQQEKEENNRTIEDLKQQIAALQQQQEQQQQQQIQEKEEEITRLKQQLLLLLQEKDKQIAPLQQQLLQLKEQQKTLLEQQQKQQQQTYEQLLLQQKTLLEQQQQQQKEENNRTIEALKQQIADLKQQLQTYEQLELQQQEQQIASKQQIAPLQQQLLQEKQKEIADLKQQQLQDKNTQIADLKQQLQTYEKQQQEIRILLVEQKEEIKQQQIEALQQKEEQITRLKQQIADLKLEQQQQIEVLKQQKEEDKRTIEKIQQEKNIEITEKNSVEIERAKQKTLVEQQQLLIQEKEQQITRLEKQLQLEVQKKEQQITTLEQQLQLQIQLKEQQITTLEQQLQLEVQKKEEQTAALLQEKEKNNRTIEEIQQQKNIEIKAQHSVEIELATQKTLVEQQQQQLLTQERNKHTGDLQQQQQIAALQQQIQTYEKQIEQLTESKQQTYEQLLQEKDKQTAALQQQLLEKQNQEIRKIIESKEENTIEQKNIEITEITQKHSAEIAEKEQAIKLLKQELQRTKLKNEEDSVRLDKNYKNLAESQKRKKTSSNQDSSEVLTPQVRKQSDTQLLQNQSNKELKTNQAYTPRAQNQSNKEVKTDQTKTQVKTPVKTYTIDQNLAPFKPYQPRIQNPTQTPRLTKGTNQQIFPIILIFITFVVISNKKT